MSGITIEDLSKLEAAIRRDRAEGGVRTVPDYTVLISEFKAKVRASGASIEAKQDDIVKRPECPLSKLVRKCM